MVLGQFATSPPRGRKSWTLDIKFMEQYGKNAHLYGKLFAYLPANHHHQQLLHAYNAAQVQQQHNFLLQLRYTFLSSELCQLTLCHTKLQHPCPALGSSRMVEIKICRSEIVILVDRESIQST
jgi:hypothetical protein